MIKVTYSEDNVNVTMKISGHANYKMDLADFDAVCGMVSVLVETALFGAMDNCKEVIFKKESGNVYFYFPKKHKEAKAITKACYNGILAVKEQFPQCFVD